MKTKASPNVLRKRFFAASTIIAIAITALGFTITPASAALFVSSEPTATVGQYDATTGATISTNFIPGFQHPWSMALSDTALFVAEHQFNTSTIGKFDPVTGTASTNWISPTGVRLPSGLALSGNTLYIADAVSARIGQYDATTGATINANFITGLAGPYGLLVAGNALYVSNPGTLQVFGKYDATTGAAIAGFNSSSSPGDSYAMALYGNYLYATNTQTNSVGQYDATTGATINANFITGLNYPEGLAVSENYLYVSNYLGGTVGQYDAATGVAINTNFITGLTYPSGLAVNSSVPEPSATLLGIVGFAALLRRRFRNDRRA